LGENGARGYRERGESKGEGKDKSIFGVCLDAKTLDLHNTSKKEESKGENIGKRG